MCNETIRNTEVLKTFLNLKNLSPGKFLGSSNSRRCHWNLKLLVSTQKSEVWWQNYVWLFYYFNFESFRVLESKSRCILTLIKMKRNWKCKIPNTELERRSFCFSSCKNWELKENYDELELAKEYRGHFLYRLFWEKEVFLITNTNTELERRSFCFSSYKNCKLKVKLWWVGARERIQREFFVQFILRKGNFSNIYVLSQCIVYWIHFRNIHTFIYQKTLLHYFILFFACF